MIEDIFSPIYGKPCWHFQQGYGSFLTLEFGEPHLHIREPRQASEQASEKVRKIAALRSVYVRGDWHLWVYLCDWRIFSHEQLIADNNSKRRVIKQATAELDGQALVRVTVSKLLISVFEFDLGGRLETIPNIEAHESTSDLWLLYEPSGDVFTLRADGQYCRMPGDTLPDKHKWQPLNINDA